LDLEDYDATGRMREALSRHADEIYESLGSDRARQLCAALFKAITVRESENRGIRRPLRLDRLARIAGVLAAELTPVIRAVACSPAGRWQQQWLPGPLGHRNLAFTTRATLQGTWKYLGCCFFPQGQLSRRFDHRGQCHPRLGDAVPKNLGIPNEDISSP
jgi:hypothetical protein